MTDAPGTDYLLTGTSHQTYVWAQVCQKIVEKMSYSVSLQQMGEIRAIRHA